MSMDLTECTNPTSLYDLLLNGYGKEANPNAMICTSNKVNRISSNLTIPKISEKNDMKYPYKNIPTTYTLLNYLQVKHGDFVLDSDMPQLTFLEQQEDNSRQPTHSLSEGFQIFDPTTNQIVTLPYAPGNENT